MTARNAIRFILNGKDVMLEDLKSSDTLLDFLRLRRQLRGTKEGCAEGDCGACTVLVGRLQDGALHYVSVNACIRFLASLDGCHVVTIEHLSPRGGALHPVQQAMVDHHGSQCGFCTPGIVMSLYALWMETRKPTREQVETALQGNLCRCTGYAPIIRAALAMQSYRDPPADADRSERDDILARLTAWQDHKRVEIRCAQDHIVLPGTTSDLAKVLASHPTATIIAGATDVGLWVTKFMRSISPAIHISHLSELKQIILQPDHIQIGAGVSYSESAPLFNVEFPHLAQFWNQIAGWQVRNMGTLGGNIANGSPIGDMPPVFIALGATLTLRYKNKRRSLPLENYFLEYGKQDCQPGEFIETFTLPRRSPDSLNAAYKVSKRRDDDISSVCVGFHIDLDHTGIIRTARVAFGGMAGVPKRATTAEKILIGKHFTEDNLRAAAQTLPQDFTPLSDSRASADYRMRVAQNLFHRFYNDRTPKANPDLRPIPILTGVG
ncbi:MAG: xanthine dehydrogenase small subunit [Paracoccaceae bacterium]|nr:xanthine dehydrogenase small subunit [Paracoccaceae bacterium]